MHTKELCFMGMAFLTSRLVEGFVLEALMAIATLLIARIADYYLRQKIIKFLDSLGVWFKKRYLAFKTKLQKK